MNLLPTVHVPRPDGGYEVRPLNLADVLSFINLTPLVADLETLVHAAVDAFNAKNAGHRIDVEVAAVEAAADAAEAAVINR